MSNTLKLSFIATLAAASFARAEEEHAHGDIRPYVVGGEIRTGLFSDNGEFPFQEDVRVFAFEFGENPQIPFGGDVGVNPGSGFTSGGELHYRLPGPLSYWNGQGTPSLGAIPDGETLRFGNENVNATAGGSGTTYNHPSLTLSSIFLQNIGGQHTHAPTELFGSGGDPTDGIYFQQIEIINVDANGNNLFTPSLPAYLVFNTSEELEDAHGEAIAFAETLVPEPASLAALGLGAIGLLRRRRRA